MGIETRKTFKDGRVETFTPHGYVHEFYCVLIPVHTLEEVESYAAKGCAVRVKGDIKGTLNLTRMEDVDD